MACGSPPKSAYVSGNPGIPRTAQANQPTPLKATVWTTYWYELYYYDDRQLIDYIYYWAGLLAYVSRVAAWSKLR
jgi:hypothetical protein